MSLLVKRGKLATVGQEGKAELSGLSELSACHYILPDRKAKW